MCVCQRFKGLPTMGGGLWVSGVEALTWVLIRSPCFLQTSRVCKNSAMSLAERINLGVATNCFLWAIWAGLFSEAHTELRALSGLGPPVLWGLQAQLGRISPSQLTDSLTQRRTPSLPRPRSHTLNEWKRRKSEARTIWKDKDEHK